MTAKKKLPQKRLILLQLDEKLGNVPRDCRMQKVPRNQLSGRSLRDKLQKQLYDADW